MNSTRGSTVFRCGSVASLSHKKRNYLTLNKKVELIKYIQKNPGVNARAWGEMFDCGKTQVVKILKNKESLLTMHV